MIELYTAGNLPEAINLLDEAKTKYLKEVGNLSAVKGENVQELAQFSQENLRPIFEYFKDWKENLEAELEEKQIRKPVVAETVSAKKGSALEAVLEVKASKQSAQEEKVAKLEREIRERRAEEEKRRIAEEKRVAKIDKLSGELKDLLKEFKDYVNVALPETKGESRKADIRNAALRLHSNLDQEANKLLENPFDKKVQESFLKNLETLVDTALKGNLSKEPESYLVALKLLKQVANWFIGLVTTNPNSFWKTDTETVVKAKALSTDLTQKINTFEQQEQQEKREAEERKEGPTSFL
ncbi:hypothetical protein [Legionella hackeliae]|uniref:hypothetical protein n=1 Tax=Legionella hackeliae TaxID=449 RepID=UPI0011C03108|nr:hypothetical protein [Legionella hackeliae]